MIPVTEVGAGRAGVYAMHDEHGAALYVGASITPLARVRAHVSKPWWPQVASITIWRTTASRLGSDESATIARLRPRHNVAQKSSIPFAPCVRDDLLAYAEAAARLSVSRATLFRMIADGVLTPVLVPRPSGRGTIPRLRTVDVDALQERRTA